MIVYVTKYGKRSYRACIAREAPPHALWVSLEIPAKDASRVAAQISVMGRWNVELLIAGELVMYKTVTPGIWGFSLREVLEVIRAASNP